MYIVLLDINRVSVVSINIGKIRSYVTIESSSNVRCCIHVQLLVTIFPGHKFFKWAKHSETVSFNFVKTILFTHMDVKEISSSRSEACTQFKKAR